MIAVDSLIGIPTFASRLESFTSSLIQPRGGSTRQTTGACLLPEGQRTSQLHMQDIRSSVRMIRLDISLPNVLITIKSHQKPHSECYDQGLVLSVEHPAQLVKMWVGFTEIHFKGLVAMHHACE
jgi:hypothetical protein